MLLLMLLVLLLIVRRNPKLLHTKNIQIHPLPFVDFFFSFPELPYTGKALRFMYLFLEFIFTDKSRLASILPFYYHPKHCRKKSSVFLIRENMDIFCLVYVYSVIPRTCQNTFIFSRGEIQVPAPLEDD